MDQGTAHPPATRAPARSRAVQTIDARFQPAIKATVVFEDSTIQHVVLTGDDSARFNQIKEQLGHCSVTALSISDQDGPAAVGWIDADGLDKQLKPNGLASALVDRLVVGRMVITGRGEGEQDSMTSVHQGLRTVLDRLASEAADEPR